MSTAATTDLDAARAPGAPGLGGTDGADAPGRRQRKGAVIGAEAFAQVRRRMRRGRKARRPFDELEEPSARAVQVEVPADVLERLERLAWAWSATEHLEAMPGALAPPERAKRGPGTLEERARRREEQRRRECARSEDGWATEPWTVAGVVSALLRVALDEAEVAAGRGRRDGLLTLIEHTRERVWRRAPVAPGSEAASALPLASAPATPARAVDPEIEKWAASAVVGGASAGGRIGASADLRAAAAFARRAAEAEAREQAELEGLEAGRRGPEEERAPTSAEVFAGSATSAMPTGESSASAAARVEREERWLAFLAAYAPGFTGEVLAEVAQEAEEERAVAEERRAEEEAPRRGCAMRDSKGCVRSVFWRACDDKGVDMPSWWVREDAGTDYPVGREAWRGVVVVLQGMGVPWRADEQPAPINVPDLATRFPVARVVLRKMGARPRESWSVFEWALYHAAGELGLARARDLVEAAG